VEPGGRTAVGEPSIHVLDTFTDRAFAGSPAAVVMLTQPAPEAWMRAVAAEFGCRETAFVVARAPGGYELRCVATSADGASADGISTAVEADGRGILAAAAVVGSTLPSNNVRPDTVRPGTVTLHTATGPVHALVDVARPDRVWIDLPATPVTLVGHDGSLGRALGTDEVYTVARSRSDLVVELADADAVRSLRPDLAAVARWGGRGVVVTASGDRPGIDVVSRYFAPAVGIPEDPVTASTHCALAPFWSTRLERTELCCEQSSRRGGIVWTRLDGDRVHLGGSVTPVWSGTFHPPAGPDRTGPDRTG